VTDTGRDVTFNEAEKPGISNLITILSSLSGRTNADIEQEFAGKGYGDFKSAVAEAVADYFSPIRSRTLELLESKSELSEIIETGAKKAEVVAEATLAKVYANLGLLPRKESK
jgi:tryptophanyl-tRNA synthetase